MELSPNQEEYIERYLRNELSEAEREAFEQKLAKDRNLRTELRLQQDITAGIDLFGAEGLKRQLQQSEEPTTVTKSLPVNPVEPSSKPTKAVRPLYFFLATAASFALVLTAFWLLNPAASSQELYTAYFEPYPNVINPIERSGGDPADVAPADVAPTKAGQAMYYYEQGNYEQAISLFAQVPAIEEAYQFYWGVSYLGAEQAREAEITLEPLLFSASGVFYEPALWYTSLAQIQSEQIEVAKASLQQLIDIQGEYATEAAALLEKIWRLIVI